jgi:hypothetical protein
MAVQIPNGAIWSIASTMGAQKTMSAITNATQGVATLEASHGVIANDILVVTSGWSKLNGRVVRAESVSTNDVTLDDINTSSTTNFPAGSGTGSVKEVTAWTQITQVLEASSSGGDQQFATYSFLEDNTERQIPTVRSPISIALTVADDPSLAHYTVLAAADDDRLPRALRLQLPGGSIIYYNAYITMNKTPTTNKNEVMGLQVTFSLVAEPTRYAS